MSAKLLAAAMLLCSVAYGAPDITTVAIVTVRGNMRIDGNQITSDAVVFDGSTVETAAASATLNMDQRSIIEMSTGTRGIVHADYVRLEQGSIDLKPTCGFVVEVNGVRVTPNSSNAHGVIAISGSGASLSSRSGEFLILDSHGRILSRVRSRSPQPLGISQIQSAAATYVGNLSVLDDHRLLTLLGPDANVKYELQNRNRGRIQGKLLEIDGTINSNRTPISTQAEEVLATTKEREMCTEKAVPLPLLLGLGAAGAAGTAAGIAVTNESRTPASR